MKQNIKLSLFLFFAMSLCSCIGDPGGVDTYYTYGNATDKSITVEAFHREYSDSTIVHRDTSFIIAPGKEFTLKFKGGGILGIGQPFQFSHPPYSHDPFVCFITYSNGEKTIIQDPLKSYKNPLYGRATYEKISQTEYKYVFTDKDFEEQEEV